MLRALSGVHALMISVVLLAVLLTFLAASYLLLPSTAGTDVIYMYTAGKVFARTLSCIFKFGSLSHTTLYLMDYAKGASQPHIFVLLQVSVSLILPY